VTLELEVTLASPSLSSSGPLPALTPPSSTTFPLAVQTPAE